MAQIDGIGSAQLTGSFDELAKDEAQFIHDDGALTLGSRYIQGSISPIGMIQSVPAIA